MDCFYINLDAAEERRQRLEENFAACKKPGWTLTRFAAVDKAKVERNGVPGTTRAGEKGCFLSHRVLLGEHLDDDKTIFIVEDDASFGVRTCTLVDAVLARNAHLDWDILFTDVCVPNVTTMFELLKYRRDLRAKKIEVAFMDLAGVGFAGSTAYLVNGRAKAKLHGLLSNYTTLDLPYDLYLRQCAHRGELKAFCLFPFVTTLSEASDASQIMAAEAKPFDAAWNLFRKMIWIERNLQSCRANLDRLARYKNADAAAPAADEELSAFRTLFSSMAAIGA